MCPTLEGPPNESVVALHGLRVPVEVRERLDLDQPLGVLPGDLRRPGPHEIRLRLLQVLAEHRADQEEVGAAGEFFRCSCRTSVARTRLSRSSRSAAVSVRFLIDSSTRYVPPVEIRAKDALNRVPTWPLRFCWKRLKGWLRPKASPQILNSRRRPPSSDQVAFRHSTSPLKAMSGLSSAITLILHRMLEVAHAAGRALHERVQLCHRCVCLRLQLQHIHDPGRSLCRFGREGASKGFT